MGRLKRRLFRFLSLAFAVFSVVGIISFIAPPFDLVNFIFFSSWFYFWVALSVFYLIWVVLSVWFYLGQVNDVFPVDVDKGIARERVFIIAREVDKGINIYGYYAHCSSLRDWRESNVPAYSSLYWLSRSDAEAAFTELNIPEGEGWKIMEAEVKVFIG